MGKFFEKCCDSVSGILKVSMDKENRKYQKQWSWQISKKSDWKKGDDTFRVNENRFGVYEHTGQPQPRNEASDVRKLVATNPERLSVDLLNLIMKACFYRLKPIVLQSFFNLTGQKKPARQNQLVDGRAIWFFLRNVSKGCSDIRAFCSQADQECSGDTGSGIHFWSGTEWGRSGPWHCRTLPTKSTSNKYHGKRFAWCGCSGKVWLDFCGSPWSPPLLERVSW